MKSAVIAALVASTEAISLSQMQWLRVMDAPANKTAFAEPANKTAFAEPANKTAFAEPVINATSLLKDRPKNKKIVDDFIAEFTHTSTPTPSFEKKETDKDDIHQMNQNEDNEILDSIASAEKMLGHKMSTP